MSVIACTWVCVKHWGGLGDQVGMRVGMSRSVWCVCGLFAV